MWDERPALREQVPPVPAPGAHGVTNGAPGCAARPVPLPWFANGNVERARRLRPGCFAQSPRRLQSFVMPALQAVTVCREIPTILTPVGFMVRHTPLT